MYLADAQVAFHWPWSATPAAAPVLKYNAGKPCWCALQHERAPANTTFGAGDVAQMQFPASGLASAPGHKTAQRLGGGWRKQAEDFKEGHIAQIGYD